LDGWLKEEEEESSVKHTASGNFVAGGEKSRHLLVAFVIVHDVPV